MIVWFKWKNGEITPKFRKINFVEERKKEVYRRVNKMLRNQSDICQVAVK